MTAIDDWLEEIGLGKYAHVFSENDIDREVLFELTNEDLRELGLPLGPRKKLLKAIEALRSAPHQHDDTAATRNRASAAPFPETAQRRQLTVMFCDLAGSTALAEQLDPEDLQDVIRRYQDVCAGIISRFEGYVARYVGDGLLVYFGFPRAHEDEAERAVRSALQILEAIRNLDPGYGASLQVRIGIATGLVVVGDIIGSNAAQEQAVVGETPNLAARLQETAMPGSVVISATTRELIGKQFQCEDLGAYRLKGIAEQVRLWRVSGESAVESRFEAAHGGRLTAFIGRGEELGLLLERWHRSVEGEGQIVLLSGEAGVGKSRIVEAVAERLRDQKALRIRYQCSAYHVDSPLHPAIQQLRFAARFRSDDSPQKKLEKLEALVAQGNADPRKSVPLLAALLSVPTGDRYPTLKMASQEQRRRTLDVLVDQLVGLTAKQPVLLIVEDVHWIDPTTRELIDMIAERIQSLHALLVITSRPECETPWIRHAHCTYLTVNRLAHAQCVSLVHTLTNGRELPAPVLKHIIDKAEGVPLFLEELTKTVLEAGLLEGASKLHESGEFTIPTTLHDSLMARLDRLEGVKEIAQIAAAIGRETPHRLLEAVLPVGGPDLDDVLKELVTSGLMYERGSAPDATYVFKHALLQDAAYESLLHRNRRQIHARIAESLERDFPDWCEFEPELPARHYTRAAMPGEAAPWWLRAGRLAIGRSANIEAIAHLKRGLDAVAEIPSGRVRDSLELDMQISLGTACIGAWGYGAKETEGAYKRARELLDGFPEDPRQFAVLYGLCVAHWNHADFCEAFEVAEELLDRATKGGDASAACVGHRAMAMTLNCMAEFRSAYKYAVRAAELYDPDAHHDLARQYGHDIGVAALWKLALSAWYLGDAKSAASAIERAEAIVKELGHGTTTGYHAFWTCFSRLLADDATGARQAAEAMVAFADEHGMALWSAAGRCYLGDALSQLGEPEDALGNIRQGLAALERVRVYALWPTHLRFEAEALARLDRTQEALERLGEALRLVESTRERWCEAELYRVRGEIVLLSGWSPSDVEASLRRALEVARTQRARFLELRAATTLAQFWSAQGRHQEARDMLASAHAKLTAGFHTRDTETAECLLKELEQL